MLHVVTVEYSHRRAGEQAPVQVYMGQLQAERRGEYYTKITYHHVGLLVQISRVS